MVYFMPPPACGRRHPAARGIMYSGCPSVRPGDCLSVRQDYFFFEWEGKTGRGDDPCLFFIYCSSLCGLHLFTGGEGQTEGLGGQGQFHFLAMGGGCGSEGFKTNLNKK